MSRLVLLDVSFCELKEEELAFGLIQELSENRTIEELWLRRLLPQHEQGFKEGEKLREVVEEMLRKNRRLKEVNLLSNGLRQVANPYFWRALQF